jgi:two-component system, chemotaxis family, chemotaxis protein CheY
MDRQTFAQYSVLVADPSSYMTTLIASMLRSLGVQDIVEQTDSANTLLALGRKVFDVILIEEGLSPIDGVKLTRQLRATEDAPNRQAAVIMTFTVAELRRIEEARDAGVTEFLRKPLSASILKSRIEAALANPRPFVEAEIYVGPDRRRRRAPIGGQERRKSNAAPK